MGGGGWGMEREELGAEDRRGMHGGPEGRGDKKKEKCRREKTTNQERTLEEKGGRRIMYD